MNCEWRWRRDSNPCKRLCRPVPSRSATPPCGSTHVAGLPRRGTLTLERMTRLELATLTLARLCATNCATSACVLPDLSGTSMTLAQIHTDAKPMSPRACLPKRAKACLRIRYARLPAHVADGRLAQLVARFLHTEEVVGSSPASPTEHPRFPGGFLLPGGGRSRTSGGDSPSGGRTTRAGSSARRIPSARRRTRAVRRALIGDRDERVTRSPSRPCPAPSPATSRRSPRPLGSTAPARRGKGAASRPPVGG